MHKRRLFHEDTIEFFFNITITPCFFANFFSSFFFCYFILISLLLLGLNPYPQLVTFFYRFVFLFCIYFLFFFFLLCFFFLSCNNDSSCSLDLYKNFPSCKSVILKKFPFVQKGFVQN